MNFIHILILMLPILIPVLTGFLMVRGGLLKAEVGDALLKYLVYITFPAVILANLANKRVDQLFQPALTEATILGVSVMYIVTFCLYKELFKSKSQDTAMAALNVSFVSAGIVGLPVMIGIIGSDNTVIPVIVNTVISLLTVVPVTVLLIKFGQEKKKTDVMRTLSSTLLDVVKNPLVASSLIGLLLVLFNISIPDWLHETFTKVGDATYATALVAVGMGINFATMKKSLHKIIFLSFLRVIFFTIFGIILAVVFHLPAGIAVAFSMIFSLPTAKSVPPIGQVYNVFVSESIQIVTITTISMLIILPIVIYISNIFWPGIIK